MTEHPASVSQWLMITLCWIATSYAVVAPSAMPFQQARRRPACGLDLLKPLRGIEPRLYENLVTFCERAHPRFQLLFGVSSPVDPAIGVVRRLQAAYPQCGIELVIDSRVHGSNLKVSNLIRIKVMRRTYRRSSRLFLVTPWSIWVLVFRAALLNKSISRHEGGQSGMIRSDFTSGRAVALV